MNMCLHACSVVMTSWQLNGLVHVSRHEYGPLRREVNYNRRIDRLLRLLWDIVQSHRLLY